MPPKLTLDKPDLTSVETFRRWCLGMALEITGKAEDSLTPEEWEAAYDQYLTRDEEPEE